MKKSVSPPVRGVRTTNVMHEMSQLYGGASAVGTVPCVALNAASKIAHATVGDLA